MSSQYTTEPVTCRICGGVDEPTSDDYIWHRCRIDLDAQLGVDHKHPLDKCRKAIERKAKDGQQQ